MSKWITDRPPTKEDGPFVFNASGHIRPWTSIEEREAWMPIPRPKPYMEPMMFEAKYDRLHKMWALYFTSDAYARRRLQCLPRLTSNNDEHRRAAELIAEILSKVTS